MDFVTDQLLALVLLINILILGTRRTDMAIRAISIHGILVGALPVLIHGFSYQLLVLTLLVLLAKSLFIPMVLFRAARKVHFTEEARPLFGYSGNIMAGALATAVSFAIAGGLPLAPAHQGMLLVPVSLATMLSGTIAMASRRKAIEQVIGYLLLENGIFIFGLLLAESMPMMVEAGALLDLVAGIFVMGIIINHINREFSSIDTRHISTLKETE
jgi:hydrogenase-4 component E